MSVQELVTSVEHIGIMIAYPMALLIGAYLVYKDIK